MSNMASSLYFLVFSAFIFATAKVVTSDISNDWGVERSSVNPLSYTDETHYSRDGTTERPLLRKRGEIKCPENETYSACDANSICQRTCDNYDKPIPCPYSCVWGCVCKGDLVRGPDKKCIKISECPPKPQAEAQQWDVERYSLNPLSYTDETLHSRDVTTEKPLLRNRAGVNCPENETYSACDGNSKCQRTCDNYDKPIICPKACVWGCVCKGDLVRGPDKKCIKTEECPPKSQAEAQQNLLTDITDPKSKETKKSPNFWKQNQPSRKSNSSFFCKTNAYWDLCPLSCPDDCNNFENKDRKCPIFLCVPSCLCKKGFVLDHRGECIKYEDCPNQKDFCPSGEEYSPLHAHCEITCGKGEEEKQKCMKNRATIVPGCTCKAGLVRMPEGNCDHPTECPTVPPKEPPKKECPENEVYDESKAGCQWTCSNLHSPLPCPKVAQPGCVCKEPLIRGMHGKCSKKQVCPKVNSEPDSYVTLNPPPYTDDDHIIPESNTEIPTISETEVWFDEVPRRSGKLPRPSDCTAEEQWSVCRGRCDRNCSNKDDPNFNCGNGCVPGCICKEGSVRGPDGTCIEKQNCPDYTGYSYVTLNPPPYTDDDHIIPESDTEIPTISETKDWFDEIPRRSNQLPRPSDCTAEEQWSVCRGRCDRNCSNKDDPYFDCGKGCVPGCICKEGSVRGPDGTCIKKEICPDYKNIGFSKTLFCDENEIPLNMYCEEDCKNYNKGKKNCTASIFPRCTCKSGFVRGPEGKCIKPSDCPPEKCKDYEVFKQCKGNCERDCSNWAKPVICPEKEPCKPGCVCKPGVNSIRAPDGKCVSFDKCLKLSKGYPGVVSTETPQAAKYTENNRLKVSDYDGCLNDNECTIACRHYGHRIGHCTGENNRVCSCIIESEESDEHE